MGSTTAIMNASPIMVMAIGHRLMGDRFTKLRFFTACFLVIGIVLSAIPADDGEEGLNEEV
jgi:drug/metabolite transporter (DMT)-like permease